MSGQVAWKYSGDAAGVRGHLRDISHWKDNKAFERAIGILLGKEPGRQEGPRSAERRAHRRQGLFCGQGFAQGFQAGE